MVTRTVDRNAGGEDITGSRSVIGKLHWPRSSRCRRCVVRRRSEVLLAFRIDFPLGSQFRPHPARGMEEIHIIADSWRLLLRYSPAPHGSRLAVVPTCMPLTGIQE